MGNWRNHGSGFSKTKFKMSYLNDDGINTEEVMGASLHSLLIWDTDLAIVTPKRAELLRECGLRFAIFGQRSPEQRRNPECYLLFAGASMFLVAIAFLFLPLIFTLYNAISVPSKTCPTRLAFLLVRNTL